VNNLSEKNPRRPTNTQAVCGIIDEEKPPVPIKNRMMEVNNTLDVSTDQYVRQKQEYQDNMKKLITQWTEEMFLQRELPLVATTPEKEEPSDPVNFNGLPAIHLRESEQRKEDDSEKAHEEWCDSNEEEEEQNTPHEPIKVQLTTKAKEMALKLGLKIKRGSWTPLRKVIPNTGDSPVMMLLDGPTLWVLNDKGRAAPPQLRYVCNQPGHFARNCPHRGSRQSRAIPEVGLYYHQPRHLYHQPRHLQRNNIPAIFRTPPVQYYEQPWIPGPHYKRRGHGPPLRGSRPMLRERGSNHWHQPERNRWDVRLR